MNKRFARLLAVSVFPAVAALAQPVISYTAINAASYRAAGMPGTGIAQGSIFTIFGTGIGPATGLNATTLPLQTTLGDTSVAVTVAGSQVAAVMLYAGAYQINALLPSNTPVGAGTFTVTYNGQTSSPEAIQVVSSSFGIFTVNQAGSGQAIATDVGYKTNSIVHTYHPGDYGVLWGTGLGAISGSDAGVPPQGNVPGNITVYVGDTAASVIYHGRSGFAGLDQINFQIPAGVTGCYVPVAVQAGSALGNIGNFATIAVSDSGDICTDSIMGQDLVSQLAAGQTVDFGYIRLESWVANFIAGTGGASGGEDFGIASFSEFTPATAGYAQYGVSSGYCVAVDCSLTCGGANAIGFSLSDSSPAQLDAGSLSVQYSPTIALTQAQYQKGFYDAYLSGNGRYLWSDFTYPVVGTGGSVVGPFTATDIGSAPAATLTGIASAQNIPISSDLNVQWSIGNPSSQNGQLTITAESYNQTATTYQNEFVQCSAPVAAQKFTIPGWVMSSLPPSGSFSSEGFTIPEGFIQVGQYNKPTSFTATGLTGGVITDIFYNGIGVYFQ